MIAATRCAPLWFSLALLCAGGLTGCRHDGAVPGPWRSSKSRAHGPSLVLNETPLGDHAVVDRLHEVWVQLEGRKGAARLFLSTAMTLDDESLRASNGARQVVAYAVYQAVQAGLLSVRFAEIRAVVDRLVRLAPKAPETRFTLGYLRWILVADASGQLKRKEVGRAVAMELHRNLDLLVREHPRYDGPGVFDRRRIRTERDAAAVYLTHLPDESTGTVRARPNP